MITSELVELRKTIFNEIEKVMDFKGKEYSGAEDRLANFKRNGEALGLEPESIWRVYAGKHWDSVSSFIKELQAGKKIEEIEKDLSEPIDGRILDIMTYLFLLSGLIKERRVERISKHNDDFINNLTTGN